MCGKKVNKFFSRQSRSSQSRPIILNRRSLSSSSIPRKKRQPDHELLVPCTSRDESHVVQFCNDIPETFHASSQTVPLPSHKLVLEDVWKLDDRYISTGYSNPVSNNNVQQPYNLLSGNLQSRLLQHRSNLVASNQYMLVNQGAPNGPSNTKPLVMFNSSVNLACDQNFANLENRNVLTFLSPNNGKENAACELPIVSSQPIQPVFLENPVDASKLFDVNRSFSQTAVMVSDSTGKDMLNDSLNAISWMGQMEATNILPSIDPPRNFKTGRPPYSYMALIQFAINSSPAQRMTLKQIYSWIEETFPYFKHAKPGWKNSIRHNLSLHDIFIREILPSSKSSYWTLRPDLNQRPLTLACVAARMGNIQPVSLSALEVARDGTPDVQQISKMAQSYVLMQPGTSVDSLASPFPTSSVLNPRNDSACDPEMRDLSPLHRKATKKEQTVRKRKRKQPLETLNDSLNDSLHFTDSLISPLVSPLLQDQDGEVTSLQYYNSTPSTSTWMKHNMRRASLDEAESGYFEQTHSSVSSTDMRTPQSNCNPSANETCLKQAHSSISPTGISVTPKRLCADAGGNVSANTRDTATVSPCVNSLACGESSMTDGLPQLLGVGGFSFNSSFAKLLNSSNVSLFNLSDRSVQFSDFEDL